MSIIKQLNGVSEAAAIIAENQGWDAESIIMHLLGFIAETKGNTDALTNYFSKVAAEEQAETEE